MEYSLNIIRMNTANFPADFPEEDQTLAVLENVVWSIDFEYIGTGNGRTAKIFDSRGLGVPDPSSFVDYSLLSKDQVEQWVMSQITSGDLRSMQSVLKRRVNELNSNEQANELPWP